MDFLLQAQDQLIPAHSKYILQSIISLYLLAGVAVFHVEYSN